MAPHFGIDRRALWDRAARAGIKPVTLTAIAGRLDVAPSTLSRALNGASVPGADLLARVRVVFGTDGFDAIVTVHDGDEIDTAAAADSW
jgi:transcriptional regulator with XRE-family HTH domain